MTLRARLETTRHPQKRHRQPSRTWSARISAEEGMREAALATITGGFEGGRRRWMSASSRLINILPKSVSDGMSARCNRWRANCKFPAMMASAAAERRSAAI
jgi:hypothetical protein